MFVCRLSHTGKCTAGQHHVAETQPSAGGEKWGPAQPSSATGAEKAGALSMQLPHPGLFMPGPLGRSIPDDVWVAKLSSLRGPGLEAVSWQSMTLAGAIFMQRQYSTSSRPRPSDSTRDPATSSGQKKKAVGFKGIYPKLLTARIMQCSTTQQLQELVQLYGSSMNDINLAAAFKQLQMLSKQGSSSHDDICAVLRQLWDLTRPQLGVFKTRQLSNMIWGLGQIQHSIDAVMSRQPGTAKHSYRSMVIQCLLPAFMQQLTSADSRHVAIVLYSVANAKQRLSDKQVQRLLDHLLQCAANPKPRDISNSIWAVATMGSRPTGQQLQQLLGILTRILHTANPQAIANTLWAVATMGGRVPDELLQQLVLAFASKVQQAAPQDVKDTLWAVATMGQQLPPRQLSDLEQAFVAVLEKATPQEIANTVWACAKQRYLPMQLLSAPLFISRLAAAQPQEVASTAWALAQLGHRDEQIMSFVVQHALQWDVSGSSGSSRVACKPQDVSNVCWSIAVLNLQQHVSDVLQLAATLNTHWSRLTLALENLSQLCRVHTWLQDFQPGGVQGLQGVLSEQQLRHCNEAWMAQLGAQRCKPVTGFQQSVFSVVQQLPLEWSEQPAMEQLSRDRNGQEDGALLIDITARTAEGVWLAIEADGPDHYLRQPSCALDGPTQYRNRALAARGYVTVCVQYIQWDKLRGDVHQQQQYLLQLIKQAQQQASTNSAVAAESAAEQQARPQLFCVQSSLVTNKSGRARRVRTAAGPPS